MPKTIFCFIPFFVCLFWFIVFAINYRSNNPAKRVHTWFLLTCTVLYFCHALYFTQGLSRVMESAWALCSLSAYPLYYLYIRTLTSGAKIGYKQYLNLLPALIVALILLFWPGRFSNMLRLVLFASQIIFVCWAGIKRLGEFDKEIMSCYADIEGRQTRDVRILLAAFIITAYVSMTANAIGKSTVADSESLLYPLALVFATMLFILSYLGYTRQFSYKEFAESVVEDEPKHGIQDTDEELGRKLDDLMREKKVYLQNNIKINDVAFQIGSCRTYLSNYINVHKGVSFSDYINALRIEDAKAFLESDKGIKNTILAEKLGFSNEQSFYRNFKKFTGMTPAEWKKSLRC